MIGCTRMYNLNPEVAALWKRLLTSVATRAGTQLEVIDHPAPAPLSQLWSRADMGCVFMCGWPFRLSSAGIQIVAAPIPKDGPCEGATYCTNFVVRRDTAFKTLEDTFGGRIAWTDEASHSGFNAPRRHLMDLRGARSRLYRESIGPLVTPRASLKSILEGQADVAPLDSYFHALLDRHEPALAAQVRVVARTDCAPIPPLVAAGSIPVEAVRRLGNELVRAAGEPALRPLFDELCLERFAVIDDPEVYGLAERWDADARAAGYLLPS
ncbi:PhnD/SsuA/transferrin family substrate-binding protein [Mesorhizobium sp. CAU 1741]|uniref:phosphate/phosphite/phosphonate ABC transporter substrate-binding protein n=1 Tax=Mesorhizobium sp. CAU 1741 TaxID=3140366 RepID=UPI00325C23AF